MRIAVISSQFPPERGGVSGYTRNWALAMTSLGHEVTVVTSTGSAVPTPGVDVVRFEGPWGPSASRRLRALVLKTRPDVVVFQYVPHAYSARGGGVAVAVLVALALARRQALLVVNGHELAGDLRRPLRRLPWHLGQRAALGVLLAVADCFVVTVKSRQERLRRRFPRAARKIVCIPIGSTLAGVATASAVTHEPRAVRTSGPWRLGSMGMGHPTQQVEALTAVLDALEHAGIEASLEVAGQLEVADGRVRHLGYLDDSDLLCFLASLDLFVLPISDGFSGRRSAPISALGVGTPVLTTWGTETDRDRYPPEELSLVAPGQPGHLAARAVSLLADPASLDELRQRWSQVYGRDLAWPVVATAWSALLTDGLRS